MKRTKKYIRNLFLFIFLIWLTFYVLLKDQNMGNLFEILKNVNFSFVLIGLGCMVIYFLCESLNIRRTLNALGEKVSLLRCYKYTLIGFFYSSITPAASGGQPMQIYYMHKDGIKAANSTLSLVINLWSFQIITIGMSLISLIFFYDFLDTGLLILFTIGISLNFIALLLLIIGIFSKKLSSKLVNLAIIIMKKLRLRKLEEKEKSLRDALEKYTGSAKYIRANRKIILRQFITAIIQQITYYSIPFWVCKAFEINEFNIIKVISLQSIVYATVSGIPSPGAVGVSEGAFVSIFKNIFGTELINGAMLLNRGISFYLIIIICSIVVLYNTFKENKKNAITTLQNEKEKEDDYEKIANK